MLFGLDKNTPQYAISMLMTRHNLPRNIKLDPEKNECIYFADRMRLHTSQGRYKGIWGHIPNEGKRGLVEQLVMRAMGLIPGTSDFYFIWEGGGGVIEFKAPERMGFRKNSKTKMSDYVKIKAGTQSDNQIYFQRWCDYCKVPYHVVTKSEEAENILLDLGALK